MPPNHRRSISALSMALISWLGVTVSLARPNRACASFDSFTVLAPRSKTAPPLDSFFAS